LFRIEFRVVVCHKYSSYFWAHHAMAGLACEDGANLKLTNILMKGIGKNHSTVLFNTYTRNTFMRIAEGLEILELPMSFMGGDGTINPVLIWDENSAVLVDAGFPGQVQLIKKAVETAGVSFETLSHIVITHQDLDHIGSLSGLQKALGQGTRVIAHVDEKPYIEFEKMPIKMTPERIARMKNNLKGSRYGSVNDLIRELKSKVNHTVDDGDEIDVCGGIKIIHTPGHTPGHICLYLKKYKILIAGDALNVENGALTGPNAPFTLDMEVAGRSLIKLLDLELEGIICYHGGMIGPEANGQLEALCRKQG
jgi:glyoxylase-like metal-dependent hydrolase (beta-lactamase superfamily II)